MVAHGAVQPYWLRRWFGHRRRRKFDSSAFRQRHRKRLSERRFDKVRFLEVANLPKDCPFRTPNLNGQHKGKDKKVITAMRIKRKVFYE